MINPCAWFLKDLENIPKNGLKVFSTFSCGGGSSMGYKLAGCEVIGANDIDPEMMWHYKLNLKPQYYFLCPVKQLLKESLPQEFFNLDILDGSPPCSSFSLAGKREKDWGKLKHFREGQSKQVLDDLFFDYLEVVNYLRPKVVIAENVKGLIMKNAKFYSKEIFQRFKDINYNPQLFLVNAAHCGVPQRRERVFFIASRNDLHLPKLMLEFNKPLITVETATKDLQSLTEAEKILTSPTRTDLIWWHLTPKEKSYCDPVKKSGYKEKLFTHYRLDEKKPSKTLTTNTGNLKHWNECRTLTFREFKRLGTFPDDYQAKTDNIGKYIVGMSVPPLMTKEIVFSIIEQWF